MKKLTQKSLALVLVFCMVFGSVSGAAAAGASSFQDITRSHWAYTYVEDVVSRNLFAGTSETTFGTDISMNRAMFVTVLSRLAEANVDNNVETKFTDVAAGQWYTGAVAWGAENGIVSGVTETTFAPETAISREQMATLIVRYAEYANVELEEMRTADTFSDESAISSYALDAVKTCQKAGLINGLGDGRFDPQGTATRAQVAVIISLLVSGVPAIEEEGTYTVTFESNGGTKVESQKVEAGEKAARPEDPKRTGYTFGGWYADKDLKEVYNFNSEVTASITLYAKWNDIGGSSSSNSNRRPSIQNQTLSFEFGEGVVSIEDADSGKVLAADDSVTVAKNTVFKFTVNLEEGYYFPKFNNESVSDTNGVYSIAVNEDTTLEISAAKGPIIEVSGADKTFLIKKPISKDDLGDIRWEEDKEAEYQTVTVELDANGLDNGNVYVEVTKASKDLQLVFWEPRDAVDPTVGQYYDIVQDGFGDSNAGFPIIEGLKTPVMVVASGEPGEYEATLTVMQIVTPEESEEPEVPGTPGAEADESGDDEEDDDEDENEGEGEEDPKYVPIAEKTIRINVIKAEEDVAYAENTADLTNALAEGAEQVALLADMDIAGGLTLSHKVAFNGNGHTLTVSVDTLLDASADDALLIIADGSEISNLTIRSTGFDATDWIGHYGVHVYKAEGVVLENLTVTGANAGILVNESKAALKGTIDVTGNGFGGIEVSKGQNAAEESVSELDATKATIINGTEEKGKATIWTVLDKVEEQDDEGNDIVEEIAQGKIIFGDDQKFYDYRVEKADGKLQTQYYLEEYDFSDEDADEDEDDDQNENDDEDDDEDEDDDQNNNDDPAVNAEN